MHPDCSRGDTPRYTDEDRREEDRRVRHLRRLVDFALAVIAQTDMPREEALDLAQGVRSQAYRLFPDKQETYELIYTPRFRRLIAEKYGMH